MTQDFTEQNRSVTLGKGVNTDFTTTEVNKVSYDKGFYIAFKEAGFDSVRFFIKQGWNPEFYKPAVDVEEYTGFMVPELAKRNIEWSCYCGVFNNAWPYGLYNSEWGFAGVEGVVKNLTGKEPLAEVPPTNQIVNTDFQLDLSDWNSSEYAIMGTASLLPSSTVIQRSFSTRLNCAAEDLNKQRRRFLCQL